MTRSRPISSIRHVDAPSRNVWPGARLVDHLLVELADAAAVGQHDAEQAAVGDRAGVRDRELARALARADRAGDAVPDDARAQLAELLRRVAAVEHVEHVLEQRARQLGVGVRARDERVEVVDGDRLVVGRGRGDRDDLLGEHVERVARHDGRLDPALAHELARRRRTRAGRRGTSGRSGPCDVSPTLWPARPMRCSPRATDFGDSTCSTRSTAPMSMPSSSDDVATRHGSSPALSISSTTSALLARERAVVGAGDVARRASSAGRRSRAR